MALLYEQDATFFYLTGSTLLFTSLLYGVFFLWAKLKRTLAVGWIGGLIATVVMVLLLPSLRGMPLFTCILFLLIQVSAFGMLLFGVFLMHSYKMPPAVLAVWLGLSAAAAACIPFVQGSERLIRLWSAGLFFCQGTALLVLFCFVVWKKGMLDRWPMYLPFALFISFFLYCGVEIATKGSVDGFSLLQFVVFLALCAASLFVLFSYAARPGLTGRLAGILAESSSVGMAIVDGDGKLAAINGRMFALLGFRGRYPAYGLPTLEQSGLAQLGDALREECENREIDVPIEPKGAVSRTLSVTVKKIPLDRWGAVGYFIQAEDVSGIKNPLILLQELQHRMDILFQSVHACELNREGRDFRSGRFFRLLGYDLDSVDVLQMQELFHPQDRPLYDWNRPFERFAPGDSYSMEARVRNAEGEYVWFHLAGRCAQIGGRLAVLGVAVNIDAGKRMEAFLAQGEKFVAVGQLTGGIAHDINNHLMTIQTSLGLLNKVSDEALRQKYSTYMQEALNNAVSMLKRMLSFSKGDEEYRLVEMNALVSASMDLLERSISHAVQLHLDIRSQLQLVWGNYYELQNILLNLGLNARDALLPDGGSITVSTWSSPSNPLKPDAAGAWYCVSVRDDGCGISPEVQKHIFEPFYTTKAQGKGSGLGLFITYGSVQRHGGTISVQSEPGKGAEFLLSFPLAKENFAAPGDLTASNQ